MKEFKSSTEKNYTNMNTNKRNKTPMTDITKKPIVRYHFVYINRMRNASIQLNAEVI